MSIILSALVGLTSCSAKADKSIIEPTESSKVLVAYFSATGTTKAKAEAIAEAIGADIYEITPASPYSTEDLDWRNDKSRSSIEMNDDSCRPALGGEKIDVSAYDVVFIGFPIWWDLPPRPVFSWIEIQNLAGKKVIPFATSGSSTISNSVNVLRNLYPDVDWQDGKLLNCSASEATKWARTAVNP